jgi:hypothetical protein
VCKIKLNDKKGARKLMPASQKALSGWIMARMLNSLIIDSIE